MINVIQSKESASRQNKAIYGLKESITHPETQKENFLAERFCNIVMLSSLSEVGEGKGASFSSPQA